jgi:hypothetical protein
MPEFDRWPSKNEELVKLAVAKAAFRSDDGKLSTTRSFWHRENGCEEKAEDNLQVVASEY